MPNAQSICGLKTGFGTLDELKHSKAGAVSFSLSLLLVAAALVPTLAFCAEPAEISENTWVSKASLPWPEPVYGTAVVNGKIYVFGNCLTNGTIYSPIWTGIVPVPNGLACPLEYDPATDTWTVKSPMPSNRTDYAVATYQNKIYIIGGQQPNRLDVLYSTTEMYDPSTDTWTIKASMPINESQMDAHTVGDKIYVIAGSRFYGNLSGETAVYDPALDSWSLLSPMPIHVYAYASAVVGNKIYVVGGKNFENWVGFNGTQVYDTLTDTWALGAPAPEATYRSAAAATAGVMAPLRIYVVGGIVVNSATGVNMVYDPVTNKWDIAAGLYPERSSLGLAVVNDTLYAIGGFMSYYSPAPFDDGNQQFVPIGYGSSSSPAPLPWASLIPWQTATTSSTPVETPSPTPPNITYPPIVAPTFSLPIIQTPAASQNATPTPSPTQQPTQSGSPSPSPPSHGHNVDSFLPIVAAAAATLAIAAGAIVYFSIRKSRFI